MSEGIKRVIKKDELVGLVAKEMGTTKKETREFLAALQEVVGNELQTPDTEIKLQGFVTFSSKMTEERQMVNQLSENKEVITVPSKLKAKAKLSGSLTK